MLEYGASLTMVTYRTLPLVTGTVRHDMSSTSRRDGPTTSYPTACTPQPASGSTEDLEFTNQRQHHGLLPNQCKTRAAGGFVMPQKGLSNQQETAVAV